jgi:hypothetical protein
VRAILLPKPASQYVVLTLAKGRLSGSVVALTDVTATNAPATVVAKRAKVRVLK